MVRSVLKDLTGQRFGRLVVLSYAGSVRTGKNPKATAATWLCLCDCGREAVVQGRSMKDGRIRSCGCLSSESRAANAAKARASAPKRVGPANHNWNPELSDEDRHISRKTSDYASWRLGVLERDDFTCQACGQRGGRLEAHHLSSFRKDRDKRYSLENGATTCKPCHRAFHMEFGIKNFTPEQFAEFSRRTRRPS